MNHLKEKNQLTQSIIKEEEYLNTVNISSLTKKTSQKMFPEIQFGKSRLSESLDLRKSQEKPRFSNTCFSGLTQYYMAIIRSIKLSIAQEKKLKKLLQKQKQDEAKQFIKKIQFRSKSLPKIDQLQQNNLEDEIKVEKNPQIIKKQQQKMRRIQTLRRLKAKQQLIKQLQNQRGRRYKQNLSKYKLIGDQYLKESLSQMRFSLSKFIEQRNLQSLKMKNFIKISKQEKRKQEQEKWNILMNKISNKQIDKYQGLIKIGNIQRNLQKLGDNVEKRLVLKCQILKKNKIY